MPTGVSNGQNANVIGVVLEENNEGEFSHYPTPDITPHLGIAMGRRCDFKNMLVNHGQKGILFTSLARTVIRNGLQQFSLGIRLIDDLQHPRTRLALAMTSSWVWHETSPLDIFWSRRSSSARNSSDTG